MVNPPSYDEDRHTRAADAVITIYRGLRQDGYNGEPAAYLTSAQVMATASSVLCEQLEQLNLNIRELTEAVRNK